MAIEPWLQDATVVLPTLADAQAYAGFGAGIKNALLQGRVTAGDGLGGLLRYEPGSAAVVDNTTVFSLTHLPGRLFLRGDTPLLPFQISASDQQELFAPQLASLLGGATLSSVAGAATGVQNQWPVVNLATAADQYAQWIIPKLGAAYAGQSLDWIIYWTTDGVDTNDMALFGPQITAVQTGDTLSAEGAPPAVATPITPSGTASEIQSTTVTLTQVQMDALVAGDRLAVVIGRQGTLGSDTNTNALQILGVSVAFN